MCIDPMALVGIITGTACAAAAIPLMWGISLEKKLAHSRQLIRISEVHRGQQHEELVRWRNSHLDDLHSRKTLFWPRPR